MLTNAWVAADGLTDLINIGVSLLAQGGDGVDAGHALSEVGVSHQFGQLRGP